MAADIDRVAIPRPCSASWSALEGDARARHCGTCDTVVHDTTALTTRELERMLEAHEAPCLRVHRDRTGRVLTRDRLLALAFAGLSACTSGSDVPDASVGGAGSAREVGSIVAEDGSGERAGGARAPSVPAEPPAGWDQRRAVVSMGAALLPEGEEGRPPKRRPPQVPEDVPGTDEGYLDLPEDLR